MQRRKFISLSAGALSSLRALLGQIKGKPTNLDDHGMHMSNVDGPTSHFHGAAPAAPPHGVVPVLTRSFDNARTGANLQESVLTPAAVKQKGLRKLFSLVIPDNKRGCEAQPLIIPNIAIGPAGTMHDIVVLCSMANSVRAYDANTGAALWARTLAPPIKDSKNIDGWSINDHWGILGTPVADPDTNTLYCVTWSNAAGDWTKGVHTLHALKLSDGSHVKPALSLEGAFYDPGHGLPVQTFKGSERKQRAGLVLTNVNGVKTVFVACGTVQEVSAAARGWVVACDVATNTVSAAWAATSRYSGGGIWMAGQGLAADDQGFLYALTGNGSFDGITEFGECFVKLQYTPPSGGAPGRILPVDWWSPYSDSGRAGGDQTADHITKDIGQGWDDVDLGSGGVTLISWLGLIVGAGKDGILYVLDPNNMGKTMPSDFADPAPNYAKLKAPPIFFTYYPGNGVNPAPQEFMDLNFFSAGLTHHEHSTPVAFESPNHGTLLYCWGENGNLRAWSIDKTGVAKYLACSSEVASPEATQPPAGRGGMPGGMLSLSANGSVPGSAILWACVPTKDANQIVSPGVLYAYDATNFGTFGDGSGAIERLWQSPQYTYNKFNVPVVAGGKVYVPTYDGKVDVYGLNG